MFIHFLIGLFGSFMGTLAIGPANLGVINITIRHNSKAASKFITGATIVEVMYATAAVLSGKLIIKKIDEYSYIKVIVILIFFVAGLYFFFKKEHDHDASDNGDQTEKKSFFLKGMMVALINPQTIPYWLFISTYFTAHKILDLNSWYLIFFLGGALTGKYSSLSLYGYLSNYIKHRKSKLAFYLNKFIGVTLIIIAIIQAVQFY